MKKIHFKTNEAINGVEKIRMTVTEEKNIGVGTENPSYTVDVSGDLFVRGNIKKDGNSYYSLSSVKDLSGVEYGIATDGQILSWKDISDNWSAQTMSKTWSKNGNDLSYNITDSNVCVGLDAVGFWEAWTDVEVEQIYPTPIQEWTYFGASIGLTDTYALFGASNDSVGGVNNCGSAFIYEFIGGQRVQKNQLIASNRLESDAYGAAVSVSDNHAVIGAWKNDLNGADTGSVYVYDKNSDANWGVAVSGQSYRTETVILSNSDPEPGTNFGTSVAISGTYIIVGAKYVTGGAQYSGAAYIFELVNGTWTEKAKLIDQNGLAEGMFGYSVAISGNYAIVGGHGGETSKGNAWIYERDGSGNWGIEVNGPEVDITNTLSTGGGAITASNTYSASYPVTNLLDYDPDTKWLSGDYSVQDKQYYNPNGTGTAVSGEGATKTNNINGGGLGGSAYGQWINLTFQEAIQISKIKVRAGDTQPKHIYILGSDDNSNWNLLKEITLLLADYTPWATLDLTDQNFQKFKYYRLIIYKIYGAFPVVLLDDIVIYHIPITYSVGNKKLVHSGRSNDDLFGYSVAIDGDTALVGAPYNHQPNNDSGSAYIYKRNTAGIWGNTSDNGEETQGLVASDNNSFYNFGKVVALNGNMAIIGATGIRAVYLFIEQNNVWTQFKKITNNYDTTDGMPASLAVNGNRVMIGVVGADMSKYNGGTVLFFEPVKDYYKYDISGNAHISQEMHVDDKLGIGVVPAEYNLHVIGDAFSSTSWSTSDDRVKHNEQPIVDALDTIDKINPIHYLKTRKMYDASHNFTIDMSGHPLDANGIRLVEHVDYNRESGIIAQQLQEISEIKYVTRLSEIVDRPIGVDYNSVLCTHLSATKELNNLIDDLTYKNTELEQENTILEQNILQIKQHLGI